MLDDPRGRKFTDKRKIREKSVMQYVTNGVEILERKEEMGTILPDHPHDQARALPRRQACPVLARAPGARPSDVTGLPELTLLRTEEAGLTPKTPFIGYKGQFDSGRNMWSTITKIPHAFLEADIPR